MKDLSTESEQWFAEYLDAHGYDWEYEPYLDIRKRPDFLVSRECDRFVCEVKEFHPTAGELAAKEREIVLSGKTRAYWVGHFPNTLRNGIRDKARQLKELGGRGLPLVIVLANPHHAPVDLSGESILEAVAGDLGISFNYDSTTGETRGDPRYFLGRNGVLMGDHKYISAVVALRRQPPNASDRPGKVSVHVVHSMSTVAVPLPGSVFDGPADTRWPPDHVPPNAADASDSRLR